jgi:hypothetical protein
LTGPRQFATLADPNTNAGENRRKAVWRHMNIPDDVHRALQLFSLAFPVTHEQVDIRRRELLATWHPHRYANLTNNPRKYMQMYKKGEAMTKDIQAAYDLLVGWLDSNSTK